MKRMTLKFFATTRADREANKLLPNANKIDCPAHLFGQFWDTINGKRTPWASNPWVWVVEFRKI